MFLRLRKGVQAGTTKVAAVSSWASPDLRRPVARFFPLHRVERLRFSAALDPTLDHYPMQLPRLQHRYVSPAQSSSSVNVSPPTTAPSRLP